MQGKMVDVKPVNITETEYNIKTRELENAFSKCKSVFIHYYVHQIRIML